MSGHIFALLAALDQDSSERTRDLLAAHHERRARHELGDRPGHLRRRLKRTTENRHGQGHGSDQAGDGAQHPHHPHGLIVDGGVRE